MSIAQKTLKKESLLAIIIIILSCSKKPQLAKTSLLKDANTVKTQETTHKHQTTSTTPTKTKFDMRNTKIQDVQIIVTQENDGSKKETMSWDLIGKAAYIQYTICPVSDTGLVCEKNQTCEGGGRCIDSVAQSNSLLLPPIYKKAQITLQACIQASKALTQQLCSNKIQKQYVPKFFNSQLVGLYNQKVQTLNDAGQLGLKIRESMVKYTKSYQTCLKQNAAVNKELKKKNAISQYFLEAPKAWFENAGKYAIDKTFGEGKSEAIGQSISSWASGAKKSVSTYCVKKMSDTACDILGEIGYMGVNMAAMGFNLELGLQTFSNAIFTINDPGAQVAKTCNQEKQLQIVTQSVKAQQATLKLTYRHLLEQIKAQTQ